MRRSVSVLLQDPDATPLSTEERSVGTNALVEVQYHPLRADLPREYMVNNLAFSNGTSAAPDSAYQALTVAVKDALIVGPGSQWGFQGMDMRITAYDPSDPKPRPERGLTVYTSSTPLSVYATARQLALCASFYSGRNIPRYRGRIYLPIANNAGVNERPSSSNLDAALALMIDINHKAAALSPVWVHCVHSTRAGLFNAITNYWVNDVWDTQRRRAPKENVRHTAVP